MKLYIAEVTAHLRYYHIKSISKKATTMSSSTVLSYCINYYSYIGFPITTTNKNHVEKGDLQGH